MPVLAFTTFEFVRREEVIHYTANVHNALEDYPTIETASADEHGFRYTCHRQRHAEGTVPRGPSPRFKVPKVTVSKFMRSRPSESLQELGPPIL